jgi:hypothetical protein
MIDALVLLLDKRELVGPEHKSLKLQLTRYVRKDQGIEQDLVMALAIGAHHAGRPLRAMMVEAGGERAGMSAARRDRGPTRPSDRQACSPRISRISGCGSRG